MYVPPGTFTEQHDVVEKSFALPPGLYTFRIIDTFGDGINAEDIAYRIDLVGGDSNRPSILTGTGDFQDTDSNTFLLEGEAAKYPLHIQFQTGYGAEEFGFSIYRLDWIESVASVASKSKGEYTKVYSDVSESLLVTRGALYKIVLENPYLGANGNIRINLGSPDPDSYKAVEYTVDTMDTKDEQWWQVKVYAGEPLNSTTTTGTTTNDTTMLTLAAKTDRFAAGMEWILLLIHNNSGMSRMASFHSQDHSEVIAYGPSSSSSVKENEDVHHETVTIPKPNGSQRYIMIVTGGNSIDGAWLGEDTSLQLYDGPDPEEESLVTMDTFQTGRTRNMFFFSLEGSGGSACFLRSTVLFASALSSAATFLALVAFQ